MYGVFVIAIVMLLLVPVGVMIAGAAWSATIGWLIESDTEARSAGPTG